MKKIWRHDFRTGAGILVPFEVTVKNSGTSPGKAHFKANKVCKSDFKSAETSSIIFINVLLGLAITRRTWMQIFRLFEDLDQNRPRWKQKVSFPYHGHECWSLQLRWPEVSKTPLKIKIEFFKCSCQFRFQFSNPGDDNPDEDELIPIRIAFIVKQDELDWSWTSFIKNL